MMNRIAQLNASDKVTKPALVLANCRVFLDFDNTLTSSDVLDEIIQRFSVNDHWVTLQEAWVEGRIGTKECLAGQLQGVRVTKRILDQYLSTVELDKGAYKLLSFLNKEGLRPVILSDNFTPIIERILECHGIKDVKVYANALRFYKDHLIPSFPYDNPFCPSCAHCKKIHLTRDEHGQKLLVYIGDGRSDICPAQVSDIVFAKDHLLKHLNIAGKPCIAFNELKTVHKYFMESANASAG